uniref:Uncharacterized protein n=1 Tax=Arundo donax TaxID=35708 RepID=A0A0A8YK47_ARUDO
MNWPNFGKEMNLHCMEEVNLTNIL